MAKILDSQLKELNEQGVFNVISQGDKGVASVNHRVNDGGMDLLTPTNVAFPAGLLTNISPNMVEIVLKKRTAEVVMGGKLKLLDWQQNDIIVPIVEKAGETAGYSDFDNAPVSGTNATFARRGHYRFSAGVKIGRLQSMQMSEARVSLEQSNLDAAIEALAIKFNTIGFNGWKEANLTYPIVGILNDPGLPAYKEAGFASDGSATFQQVYDEIRSAVQELIVQSGNHLDLNSPYRVCMANSIFMSMTSINALGTTPVIDALRMVIPNLTFEMIPEFEKAYNNTNDVIYIIGENNVGGVKATGDLGFSELALASNTVTYENHTSQTFSSGSVGAVFYKPYNVARRYVPTSI